jgi:DNA-binding XRE family transcriptional regulator
LPISQRVQIIKKPPLNGYPWHPKTFAEKLLKYRLDLGLTQKQLAAKLNVNHQTVSRWEKGENMPQKKHALEKIGFQK